MHSVPSFSAVMGGGGVPPSGFTSRTVIIKNVGLIVLPCFFFFLFFFCIMPYCHCQNVAGSDVFCHASLLRKT